MKMPALPSHPFTIALAAALVTSSPAMANSPGALTAIVAFGHHAAPHATRRSPASAIPSLSPVDAARLAPEASRHLLSMVDASSLPLTAQEAGTLIRLFDQGSPVLLHMDAATPEDLVHVAALFGIAPKIGDVILRKEGDTVEVFASRRHRRACKALRCWRTMLRSQPPHERGGTSTSTSSTPWERYPA